MSTAPLTRDQRCAVAQRPKGRRRTRRASRPVLLASLALAAGLVTSCRTSPAPSPPVALPDRSGRALAGTVVHVVDGDTVDIRFEGRGVERVRLLGIDTPETVKPDHPVDCWGPEASARTKALLPPGTAVLAQRDEEARDRYGRLLVYLWRRDDGRFVNASLVRDGDARILSISPNTAHRVDLSADAASARARGAGLWGHCPTTSQGP